MSTTPVEPWLDENYEQLRASRGWGYETLAENVADAPQLAAHFRAKAAAEQRAEADEKPADEKPAEPDPAPKGRKAPAKATAEATTPVAEA